MAISHYTSQKSGQEVVRATKFLDAGLVAIPAHPGYYADADGQIWSRRHKSGVKSWARKMKLTLLNTGYLQVMLYGDGPRKRRAVHQLVLEAFVGPCPEGHEVRHLNGNRHDNRRVNLCWGTHTANASDMRRHGSLRVAMAHHEAKLSTDIVHRLRRWWPHFCCRWPKQRRGRYVFIRAVAKHYGCHPDTIYKIVTGINRRYE